MSWTNVPFIVIVKISSRSLALLWNATRADGYRYYLKRDPVENDDVTEWMLSSCGWLR